MTRGGFSIKKDVDLESENIYCTAIGPRPFLKLHHYGEIGYEIEQVRGAIVIYHV
ncbi:hypothetical protein SBDP1_240016 [Syntrophobacter sp. SbD1]|nr:hypothetical protein SBDP1_240016 [Syntrophobacter sp. SbD1]